MTRQRSDVVLAAVGRLRRIAADTPASAVTRALRSVANLLEAGCAASLVRRAPTDIEGAYDFISEFGYGAIRPKPIQVRSEFMRLLRLLAEERPTRILEIGTARGGTLFMFTRVAGPGATLVTVDMPGGAFGGGEAARSRTLLLKSFALDSQRIVAILGNSHDPATLARVTRALPEVDLLFIDGDHNYDGVRRDWEMYRPLVRPGGLIALHDVVEGQEELVGGVPRFWSELRDLYPDADEYVDDRSRSGFGIGIIRTGGDSARRRNDSISS